MLSPSHLLSPFTFQIRGQYTRLIVAIPWWWWILVYAAFSP